MSTHHPGDADITGDFFYNQKVSVKQHKKGFRFSIDAPLLADFLPELPGGNALEVGTGCGIISLLTMYCRKFAFITALELQPPLWRLAGINVKDNGFSGKIEMVEGDFNVLYESFRGIEHVFSNPPYYLLNRGKLSPNPEIRDAKFETRLSLEQLMEKTSRILGTQGNLYLILPYERLEQTLSLAKEYGFFTGRLREVFSFKDGKQERFLIQLTNYSVSSQIMPPLVIFKSKGVYTDQMNRILFGPRITDD